MSAADVQPSASVVSTGKGIRYIQNWAYAYSGAYTESQSPQLVLDFTTGSGIIVAEIQFNTFVGKTDPAAGSRGTCTITINGETLAVLKADGQEEKNVGSVMQQVVLPPFTTLTVNVDSSGTSSDNVATVTLTGRVYDA